jgi:hypothetical protein
MNQPQPQYKFYATLLDAFKWYQASESENAEQELIDKINRVPFQSDAADKGTRFNDLIDSVLCGGSVTGDEFSEPLVLDIAGLLYGSAKQLFTSTMIQTNYGMVELYGYIDYIKQDAAIDLKTTKSYELGKFKNSLQRHVYPVSLIDDGNDIKAFEFLVTDFSSIFIESYLVDYDQSKIILANVCEEFISFINAKRHLITDRKIFNQETRLKVA